MNTMQNQVYTKERLLSLTTNRQPDFNNLIDVLDGRIPKRPTLFEFYLNDDLHRQIVPTLGNKDYISYCQDLSKAFCMLGYDYFTMPPIEDICFPTHDHDRKDSLSLNDQVMITDWDSFNTYKWPDPDAIDYAYLDAIAPAVPEGMMAIGVQPNGVLENVVSLIGYDNLCFMLVDDEALVAAVTDKVGSILYRFYEHLSKHNLIGACMVNDDWGFSHQTMLSPTHLRQFIIPWHKKIVQLLHDNGKYAIMHSCGMLWDVMDDIIDDIQFDAKHSYEDNITPVEEAYTRLNGRIAVLGGIDIDFMCRRTPDEIYHRAKTLSDTGMRSGGYALGTGNSVPTYIPDEHYYAMTIAALES